MIAALLLPDERPPAALNVHERMIETGAIAPIFIRFEFFNMLLVSERRRRIAAEDASELSDVFNTLPIRMTILDDSGTLLRLARQHGLTAYDASYLLLAKQTNYPLATLDKMLLRAAQAERVEII